MWPKLQETEDLVTFTEEIRNGKFNFFCSAMAKLTQAIRRQKPTNYLSVFDHFVGLALKGLNSFRLMLLFYTPKNKVYRALNWNK